MRRSSWLIRIQKTWTNYICIFDFYLQIAALAWQQRHLSSLNLQTFRICHDAHWKARCWPSWRLSRYLCTCLGQNKMVLSLKHESLCWRKQLHAAMPIKRNDMRENTSGGVMSMFHVSSTSIFFRVTSSVSFAPSEPDPADLQLGGKQLPYWLEATMHTVHPLLLLEKLQGRTQIWPKMKKLNQQDLYRSEIGTKET